MNSNELIKNVYMQGQIPGLVIKSADGMSEGTAANGGNLVTNDIAQGIIDNIFAEPDYLSAIKRYEVKTSCNQINIPYSTDLLTSSPSTGTRAYWTAEADNNTLNKSSIGIASITLNKLSVYITATNELIEDVSNGGDIIVEAATKAIRRKLSYETLYGTDTVKGVFGTTTATLSTAVSATPSNAQLITMYGLLHPAMLQGARWYVNQATYATLFTSGYTAIDKTFGQLTILGLPVEVHPFMSAPADNKHIMLGNFKGFAFGYKSPSVVNSLHIKYLTNEQVFRVLLRIGGNVVVSTSACEDGVSRGAFVIPA